MKTNSASNNPLSGEPSRRGGSWLCLGGGAVTTSAPFGVMGIVNLTPDSFYDGGTHDSADLGLAHAVRLHAEGADILDLGAESSRPGAQALEPEEELLRLMPVLRELRREIPGAVLSVDTYHAATAAAVLEEGVQIINDISACAFDPGLLDVLVQYKPGYVLMHSQGRPDVMQQDPRYADVRSEVMAFFERGLHRLTAAGLPEEHIVLLRQDPGPQPGAAGPCGGLARLRAARAPGPVHEIHVRAAAGPHHPGTGLRHPGGHGLALGKGAVLAPCA